MAIRIVVTAIWALALVGAAMSGEVKLSQEPLSPLAGMLAGPFIVLALGVVFALTGAALWAPVLAWLL